MVFFDVVNPSEYKDLESVFLLLQGKLVPFFIEEIIFRSSDKEAVIRFEDIDSTEQAREICDSKIYLPLSKLPPRPREDFYFHYIAGYRAYDISENYLGVVEKTLEYPGNPVFRIMKGSREILVPAAEKIIHRVDHENQRIYLDPPEGLVDLYTGD